MQHRFSKTLVLIIKDEKILVRNRQDLLRLRIFLRFKCIKMLIVGSEIKLVTKFTI